MGMVAGLLKFFLKIVLSAANILVLFGLVILYPFEKAFQIFSTVVRGLNLSRLKKRTRRVRRSFLHFRKSVLGVFIRLKKLTRNRPGYFVFGALFSVAFVFMPLRIYGWYRDLPQPILLSQFQNKSTKILDREGRLLYEIYVDRQYDPVRLGKIPKRVVEATLAVEDDSFYRHIGIRPDSMIRAATASLVEDRLQGGSTITQQLVKNVLLSPERTIERKFKEVVLALMVEAKYTKDQILELYFNNIAYGGTSWGIQSAAKNYFGKDVSDLDLAEAAMLAGLPSAPSVYSPFVDFLAAKGRQKSVLERMVKLDYISSEEADNAYLEELYFAPQAVYIRAPHFVASVQNELYSRYGKRLVDIGGLVVTTTLDLDLQEKVQEIVTAEVENAGYLNISNGAAVVLDVGSGDILAYVGSVDYFSDESGKFDAATALRQPGSSVKPITYALAFSNGYTPASVIDDSPVTYSFYGQSYSPVNYDGRYHGNVTLRQALANSYNVSAVKLLKSLGVERMVRLANEVGLKTWSFDDSYGLSVTLGGKEVRLLDLSNVFATFARRGIYAPVNYLLSVKDANGFELHTPKRNKERVLDEGVSYLVSHILSDGYARIPAFGSSNQLNIPGYTIAVKTGTTDEKRDNWTFGYTPSYVVGVWVGNNDNAPMNQRLASGLSGAAPIWNKIMAGVLNGKSNEVFEMPRNVFVKFDRECKMSEVFLKGTSPKNLCNVDKLKGKKGGDRGGRD
ncbi:PBP1A family penicillin-binding protein [candidate division WWE3 bacterium]|nr:PBP1A family penicillin-binding protein [candidate division WWE3 bacterium]